MKQTSFSILIFFVALSSTIVYGNKTTDPQLKANAKQWMQAQPVRFIENKGQMADMNGQPVPFVLFKAQTPGVDMYITEKGLTYVFLKTEAELEKEESGIEGEIKWNRIDMFLKNASIKKENIIKEGRSDDFSQYFLGHCPDGITDVHTYEKITIKEIYPGIDWVFYNAESKGFKYDFVVHPGSDAKKIKIVYRSEEKPDLNEQGDIQIKTSYGTLTENAPVSYYANTNERIKSFFLKTKVNLCNPGGRDLGYETQIEINLEPACRPNCLSAGMPGTWNPEPGTRNHYYRPSTRVGDLFWRGKYLERYNRFRLRSKWQRICSRLFPYCRLSRYRSGRRRLLPGDAFRKSKCHHFKIQQHWCTYLGNVLRCRT